MKSSSLQSFTRRIRLHSPHPLLLSVHHRPSPSPLTSPRFSTMLLQLFKCMHNVSFTTRIPFDSSVSGKRIYPGLISLIALSQEYLNEGKILCSQIMEHVSSIFQGNVGVKPWFPDHLFSSCPNCNAAFSVFKRRQ